VTPLGGDVVVGQTADHVSHLGILPRTFDCSGTLTDCPVL
jgi:hypothetical protein